jgi:hypothetical protein
MHIGYARVSTKDQSLDLQVDALKNAGCEQVFREVASGAKTARPVLDDVLSRLREGDVLVIWKLDRLGRSLQHLVTLATQLMERKVGLVSLNDPVDTHRHRAASSSTSSLPWPSLSVNLFANEHGPAWPPRVLVVGRVAGLRVYPSKPRPKRWPRKRFIAKVS